MLRIRLAAAAPPSSPCFSLQKTRVPDHEQHLARVRQQSREGPPPPVVAVARGSVPLHLVPVEPVMLYASAEDEGRILYGCLDPGETLV